MEFIKEFMDWFWGIRTDMLITSWVKGNVILASFFGAIVTYIVKRTKTTADNEVLQAIKRRLGLDKT